MFGRFPVFPFTSAPCCPFSKEFLLSPPKNITPGGAGDIASCWELGWHPGGWKVFHTLRGFSSDFHQIHSFSPFAKIAKPFLSWDCIPLAQGREIFKFPCENESSPAQRCGRKERGDFTQTWWNQPPSSPPYKPSALANFHCLHHSILVSPCCIL